MLITHVHRKLKGVPIVGSSWVPAIIVSLLLCAVLGCAGQSQLESAVNEYRARLNRVLGISIPAAKWDDSLTSALAYPTVSALNVNIVPMNINLRDFYAIQDCELGRIVAERNTALGKTQLPSQRFIYEQKLLTVLAKCAAISAEGNQKLSTQIERWLEQKQAQWPKVWAQLIQNSTEMKQGLSLASAPLNTRDGNEGVSAVNALFYLNHLRQTQHATTPLDSTELEAQLQMIGSVRLPAKIWLTQRILATELHQLTEQLKQPLATVSCPNGNASDKAKILRNVFYLFFIEEIQPIGSKVNQFHYQLNPLWQSWSQSRALSPAFKAFIEGNAEHGFQQYQQSMKAHVAMWQTFLSRCNLAPVAG